MREISVVLKHKCQYLRVIGIYECVSLTCVEANEERLEHLVLVFPGCDEAVWDAAYRRGLRMHGHVEAV